MAITAKPKKVSTPEEPTVDVEALINKGGSVATLGGTRDEPATKTVLLRVPADILTVVDAQIKAKRIRVPRNQWIIEAIVEKAERSE